MKNDHMAWPSQSPDLNQAMGEFEVTFLIPPIIFQASIMELSFGSSKEVPEICRISMLRHTKTVLVAHFGLTLVFHVFPCDHVK